MSEWKGWRGELREKSQPPLPHSPRGLGHNGRCLGCSGSREASKLLVVSLVPIPRAAARLLRAGGTWCSRSSFPTALRFSLHPSLSRMQPVYSLWGFPAPPSMFPLRSVFFPRPTRIPEHGSLVCQVQTCSLSSFLSPTKTQERYLSKASVYSPQTTTKAPKELEE